MPADADSRAPHGVILLAAGNSSRLKQSKQLLQYRGESLVRRSARLCLTTVPLDAVIVVGSQSDPVYAQVADLGLRRVDCVDWQTGMAASLRAGVSALSADCLGALVVLCDQLSLDEAHLQTLCSVWREKPAGGAASFYQGHAGVPALLPRGWFAELGRQSSDHGARDLIAAHSEQTQVVVNEALALDVDNPEDLVRLL